MALDFDSPPLYDPILKEHSLYMSDIWRDSISTFYQTLINYLTSGGIFVPRLTTDQRNDLQNVTDGQMIYNTSLNKFQGRENGAWVNFV